MTIVQIRILKFQFSYLYYAEILIKKYAEVCFSEKMAENA